MAPLQPSSAVAGCLRDTDPRAVARVALSTQRESVVLWEAATGRPVAPLVGRQDQRGTDRADRLVRAGADEEIRRRTGLPLDPMFSALKMAALLDAHEPDRTRSRTGALRLGTVDAYHLHTLTGSPLTETGNASRTQLLDLATGDWDAELLALFDVPRAALSRIVPSTGPFPALRGLPPLTDGTPLLAVLGDSHAALFAHAGWRTGTGVRAVRRAGRQYRTARPARAGTRDGGRRAGLVPAHPGPRGNRQPRPLALLRRSGNAITARDQRQLKELGAVGDMCARYFDADGDPVDAPFNDRLVGIDPDRCARWNAGSEWRAAPTGRRRSAARHAAGGSTS